MPSRFTSLKVIPKFQQESEGGFDLYWSLESAGYSPSFQVWIADTESGPWTEILDDPINSNFLLNVSTQRLNMQSALTWFKVGAYNGATLQAESWPMDSRNGMERRSYLQYRELLRRWKLTFDKTPCNPGFLLRRKIYGTKCPECLDEILDSPVSSECAVCYGTGIEGGYYAPIQMRADWFAGTVPRVNNATVKDTPGPQQVQKANIKVFAFPDAKSEDIWVDFGTRIFYLVEAVTPEQWNGSVITQTLSISKLPSHHPAYSFAIPTSL